MQTEQKTKIETKNFEIIKKIAIVLLMIISACTCLNSYLVQAHTTVETTETQFIEMRAVEIKEIEGEGKQLMFELWANDINFQGFDVRFAYDSSKYTPSNLITNVSTDDETEFYAMDTEFQGKLELFTLPQSAGIMRAVVSFLGTVSDSEHVQNNTLISSGSSIKIGRMSFKMTTDVFDVADFYLVEDANASPKTGIKITTDGSDPTNMKSIESQSAFKFTDKTASKDASLSNLILSSGVKDDDPDVSTYKEYSLDPTFDSETHKYGVTLLEYKDVLDVTAVQSDNKSTMKIKVPKRDDDNKLEYEDDGVTIKYEEKELTNNVPIPITINKLGEPDTIITVIVTAEDGKTVEEYEVTIERPYATIKGNVYTAPTASSEKYVSDIKLYKSDDVAAVIDWSLAHDPAVEANIHSNLVALESQNYTTNDDGTYQIYVIPGTYDILFDKAGYLDKVYSQRTLQKDDVLDLEQTELFAGDLNKDGIIDIGDVALFNTQYLIDDSSPDYLTYYYYDFNEDLSVDLSDVALMNINYLNEISVL